MILGQGQGTQDEPGAFSRVRKDASVPRSPQLGVYVKGTWEPTERTPSRQSWHSLSNRVK